MNNYSNSYYFVLFLVCYCCFEVKKVPLPTKQTHSNAQNSTTTTAATVAAVDSSFDEDSDEDNKGANQGGESLGELESDDGHDDDDEEDSISSTEEKIYGHKRSLPKQKKGLHLLTVVVFVVVIQDRTLVLLQFVCANYCPLKSVHDSHPRLIFCFVIEPRS